MALRFLRSSSQLDRLAVGCVAIGVGPLDFSREELGLVRQLFGSDQAFERRQPMLVVVRALVWLSAIRRGSQFIGKRGCPFLPGEMALFGKPHREGEGLGLPRLGEDRAAFVTRQARKVG